MQVFHKVAELKSWNRSSAVAIGNFDGVHCGHGSLLSSVLNHSKKFGLVPSVLTFFPHPVEVLNPSKKVERLTTLSEKLALFEGLGVELVLVEKFNRDLSNVSPDDFFVRYLKEGLRAKSVHVGFNFHFGRDRKGNTKVLKTLCEPLGIHLHVETPFDIKGVQVSSSVVRKKIRLGELKAANELLGKPYFLSGIVARGEGIGRELGFATANLSVPAEKLLPKKGVYVTRAYWQGETFRSVTNIGVRPTVSDRQDGEPVVEVHLIDFSGTIYDSSLRIEFLERIRDEKKFSSLTDLKAQIASDVQYASRAKCF